MVCGGKLFLHLKCLRLAWDYYKKMELMIKQKREKCTSNLHWTDKKSKNPEKAGKMACL